MDQTQQSTHINNLSNYFCLLTGFDSFDELNFDNCNATEFEIIFFSPTKEIALDLSWDILKIENFLFENTFMGFLNLKGINSNFNVSSNWNENKLIFENIKFTLYLNNSKITESMCKIENFAEKTFFGGITNLYLGYHVLYSEICPLVFRNTEIDYIYFNEVINSLLIKNLVRFMNTTFKNLNTTGLNKVTIDSYYEDLSFKVLEKAVFKNLNEIY